MITANRSSRNFWYVTTLVLAAITLFALPEQRILGKFLLGSLSILSLYWGLKAPRFERRMAQQTLYAVTDRQVVEMRCADEKPSGTIVKWFLFQHEKATLVEPVKQKIKNSARAYDIVYSILESEDSRSDYKFKAIVDSEGAIAALQRLRRIDES